MGGVAGMFVTGLFVGGIDAIDSSEDWAWFMAQACNGPAAFVVDAVNQRALKTGAVGELVTVPPVTEPVNGRPPVDGQVSSWKGVGAANEFGQLFISLGGLLNLVAIMDVSRRQPE
jgi:hypothetical protein